MIRSRSVTSTPGKDHVSDRIAVIVQARMSSSRLPGKVLRPLAGAPSILRMMERVARIRHADHRLVATSIDSSDDILAHTCEQHGIVVSRGPLHDVLGRMVAAMPPDANVVVRLTGDCPLVDPAIVERHIEIFLAEQPGAEYVTNAATRTMPRGLDVEVVSRDTLLRAHAEATEPSDREHVLPWVRRHMRLRAVTQPVDLSALRWTLDTMTDYQTISAIYGALHAAKPDFSSLDVYRLLVDRPDLIQIEGHASPSSSERARWVTRIQQHSSSDTTVSGAAGRDK